MTGEQFKPGQLIKIRHHLSVPEQPDEEAQVVWVGKLDILRNGQVETLEAVCVFLIERGKFKVVKLKHEYENFGERYFYEKDFIVGDGL